MNVLQPRPEAVIFRKQWSGASLALFPATYALHIAEELWGGESFPVWASRQFGATLTVREFVVINAIAFVVMSAAAIAARHTVRARWTIAALATATTINGTAHVVASLVTKSYSPGLVSGLCLWIPLGVVTLQTLAREGPARVVWRGCAIGLLAHAVVTSSAFVR